MDWERGQSNGPKFFLGSPGHSFITIFWFVFFFFLNLFIFFIFIYTFTFCGSISLVMLQVSRFDCAFVVIYLPHLYIYLGFFLSWFKSCEVDLGVVLSSLLNELLLCTQDLYFLMLK
jgi:hypothetical protein